MEEMASNFYFAFMSVNSKLFKLKKKQLEL